MSSQLNEIADIPREFLREGTQFMNRCAKPDKREFIKISQAVGIGFVVMGAIGYVVKLSESDTVLNGAHLELLGRVFQDYQSRELTASGEIHTEADPERGYPRPHQPM
ncbi:MAG: hypothetical protein L6R36_002624 [Xanthoria steineri]|nr:MAG: hypothetical protein L6R36_002624 [Xanthoria steineri]